MPPSQTPHRTPLKRVSQGSLFRLSRSGIYPDAPHGLGFLEPALEEFVDETETLQTNVEGLAQLSESLAIFNESFASWLYVMNMNALTTDWTQAPTSASFALARRRAEQKALSAAEALKAKTKAAAAAREAELLAERTAITDITEADITAITATTVSGLSGGNKSDATTAKKKIARAKLSAKERKERDMEIERIISALPLEFRGSDPALRKHMETVIDGIMKHPSQTVKLPDLIRPPDLNQARVNKCLIALVNRKVVQKDNSSGTVLYRWRGLP